MALSNLKFIKKRADLLNSIKCEDGINNKSETWKLLSRCERFNFSPRSKHTMVSYKGMIYIFGGDRGNIMLNDLLKFDVDNKVWEAVQTNEGPTPRYHHSAVVFENSMFVFGGYTGDIHSNSNLTNKNDLYEFKFESSQWEQWIVQGCGPVARSAHGAVVYDKQMWIFAGYDGNVRLNDMWTISLNSEPKVWTEVTQVGDCPPTCCNFPVAIAQDSMFVFSGQSGAKITNSLFQFHFKSLTWQRVSTEHIMRKVPPPPTRRFGHTMVAYENNLFVFGGAADGSLPNDLHCYDIDTYTWSTIQPGAGSQTPSGRLFHSATMVDDCLYIFGGTVDNNVRTGELFKFQLVCYPKCTLHNDFEALLESKEFCDVEFIVGPEEQKFPAHIALIAARSKRLAAKINLPKGKKSKDKKDDEEDGLIEVRLPEVLPETFHMMLYYIYTDKIDPKKIFNDPQPDKIIISVLDLLKLARELHMTSLEKFCIQYLKNTIDHFNVLSVLQHATKLQLEFIKNYCFSFIVKDDTKFSNIVMNHDFDSLEKSVIVDIIRRRQDPSIIPNCLQNFEDMSVLTTLEKDMKAFFMDRHLGSETCDITLKVDSDEIPAHIAILAARSSYFQALFRSFMPKDRTVNIRINNIIPSQSSFNSLLKYIYCGEIDMCPEDAIYLFSAPSFYGFTNSRLNVLCKKSLEKNVGPEYLIPLLEVAHKMGVTDMKRYALILIVQDFVNVVCLPRFKSLDKELLLDIIEAIAAEMIQPDSTQLKIDKLYADLKTHTLDVIVSEIKHFPVDYHHKPK